MIAKRIDRKPEVRDDYGHLGRYIAAAREKGEKLDKFWIVNCDAGTDRADLDLALMEIEATRLAKQGIADKTYHLVISFRPDEQDRLSAADLQDIERHFADALGYGEHQRIAGTHINTDNFHMHIAINKVHPRTGRCHTPRQDFKRLATVCREMELKYGLHIDKGMTDGAEPSPVSAKARDYEARTWQQSFERHLVEHKAAILGVIADATTWRDLHAGLAEYDVAIRKRGAGLVFVQADGGKGRMKASALDRSCSLAALETRLGPFEPAPEKSAAPPRPKRPYRAKPMTRHPAADRLWRAYRQEKKPGFLGRVLHIRNWRDYLLAEVHKDALALAIVLTYKEMFHMLDEALTIRPGRYRPPKSLAPALETWFAGSPWKAPDLPWRPGDLHDMDLRVDDAGRVLYPFRDGKGRIWAVRTVDGAGRVCDIGDVNRPDLTHAIDPGRQLAGKPDRYAGPIMLTTDCLAGGIIHQGIGAPVVIATSDGLTDQAAALRQRHPGNPIIVAVTARSLQAERAAAMVGGQLAIIDTPQALATQIAELAAKGRPVAVDPVQAKTMGAFVEDALSPAEALDSRESQGHAR